jgi:choline transport protein
MQFIFVVILLFYIGPLTEDITTAPLPLIYVVYRATGSVPATNAMIVLVMVIFFFCLFNIFASVSRLVWIFACDNGLPFSPFFAYVGIHITLLLTNLLTLCIGAS